MRPSIPQLAQMSRLLDEALPLDAAGRRAWLERSSSEYPDLAQHLREALLPQDSQTASSRSPLTLPGLAFLQEASAALASGLQTGAQVGPYELIRLLGAGGMAEVWLARRADGAFKREVALKLPMRSRVRKDLEPRFVRERDILASLEHPHIARLYDAGTDPNGVSYLAMEYVQGQPLTEWCDAQLLGIPARLELFRQVLEAVQYAHEKRVIHRDLKPSNILVTESHQVRLLDFGVSRLLEADESDRTPLTSVYGRAFTPDYASPELLRGDPIDARSDVYSLGVVLYEMLTGVRPYRLKRAASMGMLEQASVTVDVKKPSTQSAQGASASRGTTADTLTRQLRGDLDAITLKALAREPAERYPSAAALAQDIRRYIEAKPIEALPARFTDRLGKFVRRNKPMAGVTAVAVAAILATIAYTLHRETVTQAKIAANAVAVSAPTPPSAPATANLGASAAKPADRTSSGGAAAIHSLVVLPLENLSGDKEQEYFADGMTDALTTDLAQIGSLRVISRTSAMQFKGSKETLPQIGRDLQVDAVVEGTVTRGENRVRVTAQLVEASTDHHLWARTYERDLKNVLALQDEIAQDITEQIRVKLTPKERSQLMQAHAVDPEAYDDSLRGWYWWNQFTPEGTSKALAYFQKAIAKDPKYALAYAGVALSLDFRDPKNREAAVKALVLDSSLAEAHMSLAQVKFFNDWDWPGAEADYKQATALNPNYAFAHFGYSGYLLAMGRVDEAMREIERARDLDPLSVIVTWWLGQVLYHARRYDDALRQDRRGLEMHPDYVSLYVAMADVYEQKKMFAEAFAARQKAFSLEKDPNVIALGEAYKRSGYRGYLLKEAQILEQAPNLDQAHNPAYAAHIYALLNDEARAMTALEVSYNERYPGVLFMRTSPELESIRSSPRFRDLVRRIGFPPTSNDKN
jgi:serine/threonine protein kinase/TolB-like protein